MIKTLLKVSTPLILGQIGVVILTFVDSIMIGHVDTDSLAAASFVSGIFGLLNIFGLGFSFGIMPMIADADVRFEHSESGKLLFNSIVLNLLFSLFVCMAAVVFYYNLDIFEFSDNVSALIKEYFKTQLWGYPFMMLFLSFKQYFDAIGKTVVGMVSIILSNVINVVLNYSFIFGNLGSEAMGLYGAGIATFISRIFSLFIMCLIFFLYSSDATVKGFMMVNCDLKKLKNITRLSVPMSIQMGVESASFTIIMIFVSMLGVIPMATHQIACAVTTLGYMVFYGIGAATTVLVSRYHSLEDGVKRDLAVSSSLKVSFAIALSLIFVLILSRNNIGRIFTEDELVIDMLSYVIIPLALYQIGDALQIIYTGALRGVRDVSFLALISTLIHIVATPSLAYLSVKIFSSFEECYRMMFLWMVFPISLTSLGIILYNRYNFISKSFNK